MLGGDISVGKRLAVGTGIASIVSSDRGYSP